MPPLVEASERVIYVYALVDPRDGRVRYVGQTQNPAKRLQGHMSETTSGTSAKNSWLRELKTIGLEPRVAILFSGEFSAALAFEIATIRSYKACNDDLTNAYSRKGRTRRGVPQSTEARKKIGAGNTGRSPSLKQRQKLSSSNTGLKRTLEQCANNAAAQTGKRLSEEHRRKLSEAGTGKVHSVATRLRMSKTAQLREAHKRAHRLGVEIHAMVH